VQGNCTRTTLPKNLGGLGVQNLDKLTRAQRLRWLCLEWTTPEKPWAETDVPCDDTDRLLFFNCTRITLGDDNKVDFWNSG
jgi:hypothetical protein